MPRIKDIVTDISLSANDKLLGTDVSGVTRNYTLSDIASFGNLGATGFNTITHSSNSHAVDLSTTANNYTVTAQNATNSITFENLSENVVGKTGTIVITNPSSVGSLAWSAFASNIYTPGGGSINFDTTADKIAVLNYFVASVNVILVNYVGNFGAYPQP
jgi:hypothetical protein|tara:strand:- start:106 stop:585 length:480 start_codon:yes stop_codon:yes gene_type:complete